MECFNHDIDALWHARYISPGIHGIIIRDRASLSIVIYKSFKKEREEVKKRAACAVFEWTANRRGLMRKELNASAYAANGRRKKQAFVLLCRKVGSERTYRRMSTTRS